MSKVILICGKICSGKTFCANQIKQFENAVILSTDEVTYYLTDNEQGEGYEIFAKRVNAYLLKKAAELFQKVSDIFETPDESKIDIWHKPDR